LRATLPLLYSLGGGKRISHATCHSKRSEPPTAKSGAYLFLESFFENSRFLIDFKMELCYNKQVYICFKIGVGGEFKYAYNGGIAAIYCKEPHGV